MRKEAADHNNQAEQLQKIFDELQQNTVESEEISNEPAVDDDSMPKIDVLNLPPRKEVHSNENVRIRFSISRPFLRFLTVIILIVAIIFGAYFIWGDDLINIIEALK